MTQVAGLFYLTYLIGNFMKIIGCLKMSINDICPFLGTEKSKSAVGLVVKYIYG